MKWTIGILMYGDYPHLAERVLSSVLERVPRDRYRLKIGLNAVGEKTRGLISEYMNEKMDSRDEIFVSTDNIKKYPMVRAMIHGADPLVTDYFMWFDDDSFVTGDVDGNVWLDDLERKLKTADMLGKIYRIGIAGQQWEWVTQQPWYAGKSRPDKHFQFCTGGWWAIKSQILKKHNWPVPELVHRGGDVMLGELCRQQDYVMANATKNLGINCDLHNIKKESKRRGYDETPIGVKYEQSTFD